MILSVNGLDSILSLFRNHEVSDSLIAGAKVQAQGSRPVSDFSLGYLCGVVLLVKIGVYLLALYNALGVNIDVIEYARPRWNYKRIEPSLLHLASCDVQWYLEIVSIGYSPGKDSGAFYPAWPMILRLLGCQESAWSPLIAAVASGVLWSAGLVLLFRWASATLSKPIAWSMVLANLLLPSSMTFWIGFTESLFFLLFVSFLAFAEGRRFWISWIAAFCLSLTRPVGIFLIVIPGVWWLLNLRRRFATGCILSFLAGWSVYFAIMWTTMGHPLAGWAAQKYHINEPSLRYVTDIPRFLNSLFNITSFHNPTGSLLDRVAFVAAFWGILRLWKIRPSWCLATQLMLLIPAMTNQFLSFSRFTIVAIPLLVPIGEMLLRLRLRWLCLWISLSLATQYYLIHQFFTFGWGT